MNNQTTKVIRRPSRLGAVWLSYRTRWLMWGMAAGVGCMLFVSAWSFWADFRRSKVVPYPNARTLTRAEPSAPSPIPSASVNNEARKIDWAHLKSLNVTDVAQCKPLMEKGAIPQLESLTIFGPITDEQLTELCTLHNLRSLTLYFGNSLTAEGLRAWKGQSRLEYLRVLGLTVGHTSPSLDWPPNLQTLICDDTHGVVAQRLDEWRQLPKLTTLSTRLIPGENGIPDETLNSLKGFPALQRLFVQELGSHYPHLVSDLQSGLPSLRVRPSSFDPVVGQKAATILLCGLVALVFMALQMTSQFVTTASLLMPRFARSHMIPVIAVMLLTAGISFGLDLFVGCSVVASIGLCLAFVLILASGARFVRYLTSLNAIPMPGFNSPQVVLAIVFPPMILQFLLNACGSEVDWFLRGERPWTSAALLAGSIWGAVDLFRWLIGLKRELEESGAGNVPLGMFDFGGWTDWNKGLAALREGEGKRVPYALRWMDSKNDRFIELLQGGNPITTLQLWRIGCVTSTRDWWQATTLVIVAIWIAAAFLVPETLSQFKQMPAFTGFQTLAMGLLLPLAFAFQRRPMQEIELLRPVARRDWVTTWFNGVASEILPVLVVGLVFGEIMLWSGTLGIWSVTDALLVTVIFLGILSVVFSLGMWALTLNSLWQIALVGFLGYCALLSCLITPIGLQFQKIEWWHTPTIMVPLIVGLYLTAGVGYWIARRSWMNWEVGRSM
jgi:hypothetical protein